MKKEKFVYVVCNKENLCAHYGYYANPKRAYEFVRHFKGIIDMIIIKYPLE